jgi:hypothetical protein
MTSPNSNLTFGLVFGGQVTKPFAMEELRKTLEEVLS